MRTIQCGSVQFSNIRAVFFDKDGTLADSQDYLKQLGQRRIRLIDAQVPGTQEPLLMAFGLQGNTLDPAGLLAVGSRKENEIAAAAYIAETGQGWVESLHMARSAFAEADQLLGRKAKYTRLFPGSLAQLQALSSADIKVGILSADSTANVRDFVQYYHLEELVQWAIGADEGPSKPDPTMFWAACEALGVAPASTLMVGDSTADLEMGRSAGAAGCIGVTWGWTQTTSLEQADVLLRQFQDMQVVYQ